MPHEIDSYKKAVKMGKKEISARKADGLSTEMPVLDKILQGKTTMGELPLGLIDIPADLIVGTKTEGRKEAFAPNFMPLLEEGTEFSSKWTHLCDAHLEEGIREPIKAYEYMNRYYVLEGNKRVSVLKFYGAETVPGYVRRIIPAREDTVENRIYYEYLDFYNATNINFVIMSREGNYSLLNRLTGHTKNERWSPEDRFEFNSAFSRFSEAMFSVFGKKKLKMTMGDALVAYLNVYSYDHLKEVSMTDLKGNIEHMWEELEVPASKEAVEFALEPETEKKTNIMSLIPVLPAKDRKVTDVAFIFVKSPEKSGWTFAHDFGRTYLEDSSLGTIKTHPYYDIDEVNVINAIEDAVAKGCKVIFTASPILYPGTIKAAVDHKDVKMLNCSMISHSKLVRNYYCRMYEAKFILGMLAGIMTPNGKIGYIEEYPIVGSLSDINGFAKGVKAVNPRAKIYLQWSTAKDNQGIDLNEKFASMDISIVSGRNTKKAGIVSKSIGVYKLTEEGPVGLGMPVFDWGVFYELIINSIRQGNWAAAERTATANVSYWWGLRAGVIDLVWGSELPKDVKNLLEHIKASIMDYRLNPFDGYMVDQDEEIKKSDDESIPSGAIINMDWLVDNIEGHIPKIDELTEDAQSVVKLNGVSSTGKEETALPDITAKTKQEVLEGEN